MDFVFRNGFRQQLNVTLPDKTKLTLNPPKLKLLKRLSNIGQDMDEIVQVIALILSNNREGRHYDADTVEEMMDIQEMIEFLTAYTAFIQEIQSLKN